jgi:phenylpyruvate tautomerase PptA (4-oxalocrotonate tautomerase family)
MPVVKIVMLKGKSNEFKKILFQDIHQALVSCFKILDHDKNHQLYKLEKENFEIPGNRTDNFINIELTVFKGRSYEAKKNLYKAIADNLERDLNIQRTDVFIVLNEQPKENWGIRGIPSSELDLGFKVEV